VEIAGKTDPGMTVTINGEDIFVDREGNFKAQLGISSGPKEFVIMAKNRFDKSVLKNITVVGQGQAKLKPGSVELFVEFTGNVIAGFVVDDQPIAPMEFMPGESKQLAGKKKIEISTSDAGATRVYLNGQNLGFLGREGESLQNIPFFAESGTIR
jgi:hypothetical protein